MGKQRRAMKKLYIVILLSACFALGLGLWGWRILSAKPSVKIPQAISDKLLFTPYIPQYLPAGYMVDTTTFTHKESALLFAARNESNNTIAISEQSLPKNFDTNSFYESNMKNPIRLKNTEFETIFGSKNGQPGSIIGVTTNDNTWVVLSSTAPLNNAEARQITAGLAPVD